MNGKCVECKCLEQLQADVNKLYSNLYTIFSVNRFNMILITQKQHE